MYRTLVMRCLLGLFPVMAAAALLFGGNSPAALPGLQPSNSNRQGKPGKLTVLVLEGAPYERGLAHGKALKARIHKLVEVWKADIKRVYASDPVPLIKRFLEQTEYVAAIKKWTPD